MSNDNEEVPHIPQRFKTENSPSEGLMSYLGHFLRLRGLTHFAEMHLAYSTNPSQLAGINVGISFCYSNLK